MKISEIYSVNNIDYKNSSSKKLFIRYNSVDVTERNIIVNLDDVVEGYGFDAFCELRNAERTFRFDRIDYCEDTETGEILDFDLAINKTLSYLKDTSTGGLENALKFYSGDIAIKDKEFMTTGKFKNYPKRNTLYKLIEDRGGIIKARGVPTHETDYLIVGDGGSSLGWKNKDYGRKLKKAMDDIARGRKIKIIHESLIIEYLEK